MIRLQFEIKNKIILGTGIDRGKKVRILSHPIQPQYKEIAKQYTWKLTI